jgi:hypothetical protein
VSRPKLGRVLSEAKRDLLEEIHRILPAGLHPGVMIASQSSVLAVGTRIVSVVRLHFGEGDGVQRSCPFGRGGHLVDLRSDDLSVRDDLRGTRRGRWHRPHEDTISVATTRSER